MKRIIEMLRQRPKWATRAFEPPKAVDSNWGGSLADLIAILRARPQAKVVAGPWISELGFELLYWIPFLRWLFSETGVARKRVTAVSRGGVASWYGDVAAGYVDGFDVLSVEKFRALNEERAAATVGGSQKHVEYSPLDHAVLSAMTEHLGDDVVVVHPSVMYALFQSAWNGSAGRDLMLNHLSLKPFKAVEKPAALGLPERYVTVKFYARPSFPFTEENLAIANELVRHLARTIPVVSLSLAEQPDDHTNFPIAAAANVIHLGEHIKSRDNLAIQSAVIAHSEGLYGTYGGFCYLPLLYGRPSVGLCSISKPALSIHYELLARTAHRMKTSCTILPTSALTGLIGIDAGGNLRETIGPLQGSGATA